MAHLQPNPPGQVYGDGRRGDSVRRQINNFETLKAVAEDIQARREELGVLGAFTSAGMDASSDWRFKTHLANLPVYYEYKADGITPPRPSRAPIWKTTKKSGISISTTPPASPPSSEPKRGEDAASEFALGEAVFYQNGTWAYADCIAEGLTDDDLGMLPIYIGVDGGRNAGPVHGVGELLVHQQECKARKH